MRGKVTMEQSSDARSDTLTFILFETFRFHRPQENTKTAFSLNSVDRRPICKKMVRL